APPRLPPYLQTVVIRVLTDGPCRRADMANLRNKIKLALDEARMLVLGSQILVGFQYRVALESGFDALPAHARYLKLLGLASILLANLLLVWPATYHQISEDGEDTPDVHAFTT